MQYKVSRRKRTSLKIQIANDLCCRGHSLQHLSTFFHMPFLSRMVFPTVEVHSVSVRQRWQMGSPASVLMVRGINTPNTTFPCLSAVMPSETGYS